MAAAYSEQMMVWETALHRTFAALFARLAAGDAELLACLRVLRELQGKLPWMDLREREQQRIRRDALTLANELEAQLLLSSDEPAEEKTLEREAWLFVDEAECWAEAADPAVAEAFAEARREFPELCRTA